MLLLASLAVVQTVIYGAIYWLSHAFAYGSARPDRPILLMLALFFASFLLYLAAIRAALGCKDRAGLSWAIVISALVFRGVLLPTAPIQEVDIYRYLWDGATVAHGVNPYRHPPAHALAAEPARNRHDDLQKLVELRESSPEMAEVLRRIHYSELSTVYPPVSQAVFAFGNVLTPDGSSVDSRVTILKSLIVLFDVGTIGLVWLILRRLKLHPGWVVAYAWCPLVLKEFANTGHLDSIAVFFVTASVWCVVEQYANPAGRWAKAYLLGGGMTLALGVGAKLYPVILLPVLVAAVAGNAVASKRPLRYAAYFAGVTGLFSCLLIAPLLLTRPATIQAEEPAPSPDPSVETVVLPVPPQEGEQETGLKAFLTHWEMNDFLFMLLVENLRTTDSHAERPPVWFAIVPTGWRAACITPVANRLGTSPRIASFLVVRALTLLLFAWLVLQFSRKVYRHAKPKVFLEATFLTLAWFWLLSPTQNPWYWTWALPFLPFARGRAWYVLSGLTFLYYLRFWLRYHFADSLVLGTAYDGVRFFDFVVTWLEFGPWLVWLSISAYLQGRATCRKSVPDLHL